MDGFFRGSMVESTPWMVLHRPVEPAWLTRHLATSTSNIRELRLKGRSDGHCLSVGQPLELLKITEAEPKAAAIPSSKSGGTELLLAQLPAAIRAHPWPANPGDGAKTKLISCRFFGLSNDYLTAGRFAKALSRGNQGGTDEIHLFGVLRLRQI